MPVSSGALAAYLFGALLIVLMSRHDTLALIVFVALTARHGGDRLAQPKPQPQRCRSPA